MYTDNLKDVSYQYYYKRLMLLELDGDFEKDFWLVYGARDNANPNKEYNTNTFICHYGVKNSVLFTRKILEELVMFSHQNSDTKVVLIYKNTYIRAITLAFNICGIKFSGGNNDLNHVFSPQHYLLKL